MKVGLFIPCYINAIYPQVGVASYKLLKNLGVDVDYPLDQTCCGQPMANAGFQDESLKMAIRFDDLFRKYDYIVGDWGYDQLRLRGFYAKPGQGEEEQGVGCINDYLMEECNFGCPYFIIQNLEVAHPKRPRKPRTRRRGRAEISEEKSPLKNRR